MTSPLAEYLANVKAVMSAFDERLRNTDRKAANARVGITSSCDTIRVEVGGDSRIKNVEIKRGAFSEHDETTLGDLIVETYNKSLQVVQQAQWKLFHDELRHSHSESQRKHESE